jgi:hypothetical protein
MCSTASCFHGTAEVAAWAGTATCAVICCCYLWIQLVMSTVNGPTLNGALNGARCMSGRGCSVARPARCDQGSVCARFGVNLGIAPLQFSGALCSIVKKLF